MDKINVFSKSEIVSLLSQTPAKVKLDDIDSSHYGRLTIQSFHNVEFEVFLSKNCSIGKNKLYVFLSAVGGVGIKYPTFHRVTWINNFDGLCLFIDDPTRNSVNLAPTFFFGSKDTNYLDEIAQIIHRILKVHNISNSDLVFLSSSNGGFGSIYLSCLFPSSICIALNPQYSIKEFFQNDSFINTFGISWDECPNRVCLIERILSTKSKIFLYENIGCPKDKIQLDLLSSHLNYNYNIGYQSIADNVKLFCVNIKNRNPHLVQPNAQSCQFFESLLRNSSLHECSYAFCALSAYMRDFYLLKDTPIYSSPYI